VFVSSYSLHACFYSLLYFHIIASVAVLMLLHGCILRAFNKYSTFNTSEGGQFISVERRSRGKHFDNRIMKEETIEVVVIVVIAVVDI